jgi:PAS domain S-box-containing protein
MKCDVKQLLLFTLASVIAGAFSRGILITHTFGAGIAYASGLYLAVLLSSDKSCWPRWAVAALVAGAAAEMLFHGAALPMAFIHALAHLTGASAAAWLIHRTCGFPFHLHSTREVLALLAFAAMPGAVLSAGIEFVALALGAANTGAAGVAWVLAWTEDVLGQMIGAAVVLAAYQGRSDWRGMRAWRRAEAAIAAVALTLVVYFIFTSPLPLVYLVLPPLLWAGLRFGLFGMALALTLISGMALHYTVAGFGPYVGPGRTPEASLLMAQAFLIVGSAAALLLVALASQWRRLHDELEALVSARTAALQDQEQKLRDNEERFRIARAAAKMIVVDWDIQNDEITFSESPAWLRGPLPANGKYPLFKDQVHADDRAHFLEMRQRGIDTLEGQTVRFRMVRTDGMVLHIESYQSMFAGPDGKAARMVAVHQDISTRHQIEADLVENQRLLAASEARYRTLFENNPLMYFMLDAAGFVVSVNPQGASQLGYRVEELVGRPVTAVFPGGVHRQVLVRLRQCLDEADRVHTWEITKVRKDGSAMHVRESAVAVRGEDGAAMLLVMCENVTAHKQAEIALRESEQRLRTLLDAMPDLVRLKDAHGRYIMVNRAAQERVGLPLDEIIGKSSHDVLPAAIAAKIDAEERQMFASGETVRFERPAHIVPNAWRELIFAPIRDAGGAVNGLVSIDRDITERKRAEIALRDSEQRLRTLLDAIPYPVSLQDAHGHYVMTNLAAQKSFGLPGERIIGKTVFELRPPAIAALLRAEDRQALAAPGVTRIERHSYMTPEAWLEEIMAPIRDAGGAAVGLVSIDRDITGRKNMEIALRESEQRLRAVLDAIPDRVRLKDVHGRYVMINRAAQENLGLPMEQIIGRTVFDVRSPTDAARIHADVRSALAANGPVRRERFSVGDGTWREIIAAPFRDSDGVIVGVVDISRDITERKQSQLDALRDANDKLRRLSERQEALLESERTRIAHNLHDSVGQSLNLVRIKLDEIAAGVKPVVPALAEITSIIEECTVAIRTLEFELSPPVLRELGLAPALDWLAEEMQHQYGLRVDVSEDGESYPLSDSAGTIAFRAIRELLINVVKHAGVARAHVDMQRAGRQVIITVSDEGAGFDDKTVAAGLGLVSVRDRLRFIGGSAIIDGAGGGTVATLTLPLAAETV